VNALNAIMTRNNVPPGTGPLAAHTMNMNNTASEEFPVLTYDNNQAGRSRKFIAPYNDPSRTRFAAALKKPAQPPLAAVDETGNNNNFNASIHHPAARREVMGSAADHLHHQMTIVAPRPSPRIKLRLPTLLPTLPTGESLNSLYMAYRARGIQLGGTRNACLSRAADAWRRGDGAAAKRFSREGHDLNAKMAGEMADAALKLVRERARVAEQAVRSRDTSWSDDPGDRVARGKVMGGGLGVCLGISSGSGNAGDSSAEERTEAMLDLHGLHANEAREVLEQFLLAVSFFFCRFVVLSNVVYYSSNVNISMVLLMLLSARKSTLELRTLLVVHLEHAWRLVSANGSTDGDTHGAKGMGSYALILSLINLNKIK